MMDVGKHGNELRRPRPGACHRCGWRGLVSTVPVIHRILQPSIRDFGRLCRDCRDQLSHDQLSHVHPPRLHLLKELHVRKDRRVGHHHPERPRHVA
jgi:hypothetical protein